jgi:hypothetical protein
MNVDEIENFILLTYCLLPQGVCCPRFQQSIMASSSIVRKKSEEFRKHRSKTDLSEVWLNISQT